MKKRFLGSVKDTCKPDIHILTLGKNPWIPLKIYTYS
jgi:hypothetical protein